MTTGGRAKPADRPTIVKLDLVRVSKIECMNSITTQRTAEPGGDPQPGTGGIETVSDLLDRFGPVPLTLLGVWAHPDDESFLAGGLLAEVARRGGTVVVLTATAGEHGTADPVAEPPAVLARRRLDELDTALEAIGGGRAVHLGYGDGDCHRVDERLAAHLVGRVIDDVGPDLIVGFGPDGVTGHPDHIAVGRWTRRAVADRGDTVPLLSTAAADSWHPDGVDRLHSIDAFWPGFPVVASTPQRCTVRLDVEQLARKLAALMSHASQMTPVAAALGPDHLMGITSVESYVAANATAAHHLSQELVPLGA